MRLVLSALLVLAACASPPATAGPLLCHANLPYGGTATFSLTERGNTLLLDAGHGNQQPFKINRAMSDREYLIAAMPVSEGTTSLVLEDGKHLTQTFAPKYGDPIFVYGECEPL